MAHRFNEGDKIAMITDKTVTFHTISAVNDTFYSFTDGSSAEIAALDKNDTLLVGSRHCHYHKFNLYDIIVTNDGIEPREIVKITGRSNANYFSDDFAETCKCMEVNECESKFHKWTINDARHGDFITDNDGVFIFNKMNGDKVTTLAEYYRPNDELMFEPCNNFANLDESDDMRPSTSEEIMEFMNAVDANGLVLDEKTMTLSEIPPTFNYTVTDITMEQAKLIDDLVNSWKQHS